MSSTKRFIRFAYETKSPDSDVVALEALRAIAPAGEMMQAYFRAAAVGARVLVRQHLEEMQRIVDAAPDAKPIPERAAAIEATPEAPTPAPAAYNLEPPPLIPSLRRPPPPPGTPRNLSAPVPAAPPEAAPSQPAPPAAGPRKTSSAMAEHFRLYGGNPLDD